MAVAVLVLSLMYFVLGIINLVFSIRNNMLAIQYFTMMLEKETRAI